MEVILLERVAKLGQMGETVNVKPGYARNFLLARGKAPARDGGQQGRLREAEGAAEARNLAARAEPRRWARRWTARPSCCSGRRASRACSTAPSPRATSPMR